MRNAQEGERTSVEQVHINILNYHPDHLRDASVKRDTRWNPPSELTHVWRGRCHCRRRTLGSLLVCSLLASSPTRQQKEDYALRLKTPTVIPRNRTASDVNADIPHTPYISSQYRKRATRHTMLIGTRLTAADSSAAWPSKNFPMQKQFKK